MTPEQQPAHVKKKAGGARVDSWIIRTTFLCWLLFILNASAFTFAFQEYAGLVWILLTLSAMMALLFILLGMTSRRMEHVATGFLALAGLAVAGLVGYGIATDYMADYWRLSEGSLYDNVHPGDAAASRFDAVELKFATGSFVDARR